MRRLGVLVLALLACAACAGGTGGSSSQAGAPIKIGLLTSLTGNYAPLGSQDKLAAEQLVNQVNGQGGINGHKIDLIQKDDHSDPNQTVVAYNQLVDSGVAAIEGPPQSTSELAIQSLVDQKAIPDVSVGAADEQTIPVHPYMWQTTPLSSQVANAMVSFLKAQGKTKVATLTDTKNAYAVDGNKSFDKLAQQAGIQVVDPETFELGQTDFTPQFAKIVAQKPDFLVVWATGAPPVVITKQWAAASSGIPLMMSAAEASPLYIQPAGAAAENVYIAATLGVIGQHVPGCNKFKSAIDAFAGPYQKANKLYPPQFAWDSMLAMTFLFDAIKRKGTTPQQIKAGLDSINLDTPQGHYSFTGSRHYGMPNSSNLMTQVKGGQMLPVGQTQQSLCGAGQGSATQFA